MKLAQHKSRILWSVLALLVLSGASYAWINRDNLSSAADARNFNPGNIMSDFVMTNKNSMTVAQIQTFLKSKNSCNDTNISKAAAYPHLQYNIKNDKFVCLAEESFNGESAAQIIWQAGQDYNINPQVLIVLLQKEQGLITDTWPNSTQYRSATGYGCPDTSACDTQYYGFKNQVRNAANFFRAYQTGNTAWYKLVWPGNKYTGVWQPFYYNVRLHPNESCGTINTYIENRATASLYSYTPYRPNQPALNAQYGTGDSCSSYGNRNFWMYFNDWFGDTHGLVSNGIDYSPVFDPEYYLRNNPDVKTAYGNASDAFAHFINYGMKEGRQGSESFNVIFYRNHYLDLRINFRNNLALYYRHYVLYGLKERRLGTGDSTLTPLAKYNKKDYSKVYDYNKYLDKNPDLKRAFSNDDIGAMEHFVYHGMREGRVANDSFDVSSYRGGYPDLRTAFGSNLQLYYIHYLESGINEGRTAINNPVAGTSTRDGTKYSSVYDFNFYRSRYGDVLKVFQLDDNAALLHFIMHGMKEGRQANENFNVIQYKNRYPDLQRAFGNNLQLYYLHYMQNGKQEGRLAT